MTHFPAIVETYLGLKERLLADFPELLDDPDTLRDTLEGITDLHDIVGWLGRRALEAEADAATTKALARTYLDRADRREKRSARLRDTALRLMQAVELKRIDRPELTITRSATPAHVLIPDPAAVPDEYCRIEKKPMKPVIKRMLEAGEPVNWATLTEPGETLRITR